jgi:hypothetical protein
MPSSETEQLARAGSASPGTAARAAGTETLARVARPRPYAGEQELRASHATTTTNARRTPAPAACAVARPRRTLRRAPAEPDNATEERAVRAAAGTAKPASPELRRAHAALAVQLVGIASIRTRARRTFATRTARARTLPQRVPHRAWWEPMRERAAPALAVLAVGRGAFASPRRVRPSRNAARRARFARFATILTHAASINASAGRATSQPPPRRGRSAGLPRASATSPKLAPGRRAQSMGFCPARRVEGLPAPATSRKIAQETPPIARRTA